MDTNGFFKKKKVLITGGYGFIGAHLVARLLQEQAHIAVLTRNRSVPWRLKDIVKDIEIWQADIGDLHQVQSTLKTFKPHYMFHLAAYGTNSVEQDYWDAIRINVIGTVNMVNEAINCGCEKIVTLGSSAEYGDQSEIMNENMVLAPVNIYGSTKAAATIIAHQIASEKGCSMVTLRPFGVFGEGEEKHKIFAYILLNLLQNKDVDLTSCEQYRDYCYVGNIVDGLLLAAQSPSVKNEIFNIGSGEAYPLKHFVEMIFSYFNTDRKPNYGAVAYRENERWHPQPDITKIRSRLQWEPRISLEDGIIRTINWFRQNKALYFN